MERVVEDFILYLHETKNTSKNTEVSYERDLKKLIRYLQEQDLTSFSEVTCTDLQGSLSLPAKKRNCSRRPDRGITYTED